MSGDVLLVSSPEAAGYDLGEGHPMRAVRTELTTALATSLGIFDRPMWSHCSAPPARGEELALVHTEAYVAMVGAADRLPPRILASVGLGTDDTPVVPRLHESAAAICGASLAAAQAVWSGTALHAVSLSGGLHHAMPGNASGFCVYNDAAIAIADLLRAGVARVAYVDLDAHHGDGVEAVFNADPRVLTISLHQDGRTLFPGTGSAQDIGAVGAEGTAVNVALPPGTDDGGWLRAISAVVPPLVRSFAPQVLVMQSGCDGHRRDPLTDLRLTVEGFGVAYAMMHGLAHEVATGRWVVLGGGGYDLGSAVPRAWTQLLATVSDAPLPSHTVLPAGWRQTSLQLTGQPAPRLLGDGTGEIGWSPWDGEVGPDALDHAIQETRSAVFPLHGLDPHLAH